MSCHDFRLGLEALAQGRSDAEAEAHLAECAECSNRLAQFRRLVSELRSGGAEVPSIFAEDAPPGTVRLVAKLLGNGLAHSGARRSNVTEFALHVGVEGFSIYLAYAALESGWELLGRAPNADWSVVHDGVQVSCGASGRFRLLAASLERTAFVLRKDGTDIVIPSAREMVDFGP